MDYQKVFNRLILFIILFTFVSCSIQNAKKGTRTAEFFPNKVIIIDSNENSKPKSKEIETPSRYAAIRGDNLAFALAVHRYDKNGEKEQTIPVIHLSLEILIDFRITVFRSFLRKVGLQQQ